MKYVLKHEILYLCIFTIGALLSFYKLGLLASLLDKKNFGIYSLIFSSYVYLVYLFGSGANEYVLKEASLARSSQKKQNIRNQALTNGIFTLILGIVLVSPIFLFFVDGLYSSVFFFGALLAVASLPFSIFESYFRSEAMLVLFAGMMATKAAVVVVFLLLLSKVSSFHFVIWVELIAFCCVTLFVVCRSLNLNEVILERVSLETLKKMWRNGLAFSLATMFKNSITVIDKLCISAFLGAVQLGCYAFVLIFYQASLLGSGVIMSVVGPHILSRVSSGLSINRLAVQLLSTSLFVLIVAVSLFYPISWLFESIVVKYFTQYDESITYTLFDLVYLSAVATFVSSLFDWYFLATSKERLLTILASVSLIFAVFGFVIVGNLALDIYAFVLIFAVSRLISPVLQFVFMAVSVGRGGDEAFVAR